MGLVFLESGAIVDEVGVVRVCGTATLYHWALRAWLTYWSYWGLNALCCGLLHVRVHPRLRVLGKLWLTLEST
jgi:hypothetical protein